MFLLAQKRVAAMVAVVAVTAKAIAESQATVYVNSAFEEVEATEVVEEAVSQALIPAVKMILSPALNRFGGVLDIMPMQTSWPHSPSFLA